MQSLLQKTKEWEYENQKVFLRLIQTSSDVSVESVKAAGLLTSFLVFVIYKMIRSMLALGAVFIYSPQLVQRVAPGERPLESHEFQQQQLELQSGYSILKR